MCGIILSPSLPLLQEMSVFLFNKQTPEFEKLHKKQREQILEMLRKDPTNLVRLKHPRVLTIDHPLQETKCVCGCVYVCVWVCFCITGRNSVCECMLCVSKIVSYFVCHNTFSSSVIVWHLQLSQ